MRVCARVFAPIAINHILITVCELRLRAVQEKQTDLTGCSEVTRFRALRQVSRTRTFLIAQLHAGGNTFTPPCSYSELLVEAAKAFHKTEALELAPFTVCL